jgi:hypothetical protein
MDIQIEFQNSVREGETAKVAELLKNPDLDVNATDEHDHCCLYAACNRDETEIVKLLLKHPKINVNARTVATKQTPFSICCWHGREGPFRALLKDKRVDLNTTCGLKFLPLFHLVDNGYTKLIELWIASGRYLDLGDVEDIAYATSEAEKDDNPQIVEEKTKIRSLLSRYKEDPARTILDMKLEHPDAESISAWRFAYVIFCCDDLLKLKKSVFLAGRVDSLRFMRISIQLPIELQMLLCRRAAGSSLDSISSVAREEAFRDLAGELLSEK